MSEITRALAEQLAANETQKLGKDAGREFAILVGNTLERERAWVFFYNSRKFVESRNFNDRIFGNGPIIVEKLTGRVVLHGSNVDLEQALKIYGENITKS